MLEPPAGRFAIRHVIVPASSEQPGAATNVVPRGSVSVRLTPLASDGPLFATVSVYVISAPATTGSGAPDFVTDRSAIASTIVEAAAVLLVRSGSAVTAATVALVREDGGVRDAGLHGDADDKGLAGAGRKVRDLAGQDG